MILGHIVGIPVEESVLQVASAGAAVTAAAVAGRTSLARLRNRTRALMRRLSRNAVVREAERRA